MAAEQDQSARISELRERLHRANRAYYVEADPLMGDAEFDRLLAELAEQQARPVRAPRSLSLHI